MSAEWQFLITLNEQLRPLKDPVEIQDVAVRLLGENISTPAASTTRTSMATSSSSAGPMPTGFRRSPAGARSRD